jgi:diguanylate cyclase (GGDEF)-like protein
MTLVLPHGHVNSVLGTSAVAFLALNLAVFLFFFGERLPGWLYQLISPLGSLMIGGVMFWGGSYAFAYEMLFVWAALYSFSFFNAFSAFVQALTIAVVAGLYLYLVQPTATSTGYFLMVVGTGAVAGILIQRLIRQVEGLASVDSVTSAFNRRTWDMEFPRSLARAARSGRPMCVAIADLDHFKIFNDEHGHQAGDRLLNEMVTLWQNLLRTDDILARYGGEEFAIILEGCDLANAMQVADKLRAAIPAARTCTIGVAQWDGLEGDDALMARADAALYEGKRLGRDRSVAAPTRQVAPEGVLGETARWAQSLYTILSHHHEADTAPIAAAFQPIVNLHDGSLYGLEALARPIGAAAGISVEGLFYTAQRLGRTRDLDWACRRTGLKLAADLAAGIPLFLNTSMAALLDPLHDVDQMLLLLRWAGRDPGDVVLELTERETVLDLGRMSEVLALYRAEGFRFAVDDLGEGRSGMEVVAAALPEYIKVARRLVRDQSIGSRALLQAAVAFAATTGAAVIAEGIETADDVERVRAAGIPLGQGYLLGRPAFEIPELATLPAAASGPALRVL